MVLLFSNTAGTSSLLKALSAEYRRRLLIGELKKGKVATAEATYAIGSFPTLVGIRQGKEPLRFEKKVSHFALDLYLGKLTLKQPVLKKPAAEPEAPPAEPTKEPTKEEL